MIEVRNTLFQPLTFHLAKGPNGMQEGLHLGPRERRRIRNEQLSPEIEKAAGRGLVTLVHLPDETAVAKPSEAAPDTPAPSEAESSVADSAATDPADAQSTATSRKRR